MKEGVLKIIMEKYNFGNFENSQSSNEINM